VTKSVGATTRPSGCRDSRHQSQGEEQSHAEHHADSAHDRQAKDPGRAELVVAPTLLFGNEGDNRNTYSDNPGG
jgi:hypothetical protein